MNLYQAKKNGTFLIVSVPDIELLSNLGLREGVSAEVKSRYALGGPVLLRVENSFNVALGKDIAIQIGVREVKI
ncbi:MAG: ferrous iron transport protein A [Defluviitaleaceae bacterium]|nr:ferrous iron transport protein A [Defluviitaleaceae bacterium]